MKTQTTTSIARRFTSLLVSLMALMVSFLPCNTQAETVTIWDNFTTTTNADLALTTAAWDTTAGQLRLHAQGLLEIGTLNVSGTTYAAVWKDTHLLMATREGNSLAVVDATDPTNPLLVREHAVGAEARHVTVGGDWAYVSTGGGLGFQVVNLTDVSTPVNGVHVAMGSYTGEAVVHGSWIYTAGYNGGVGVAEISDPASPVVVPGTDLNAWVRAIAVQGSHLYLGANNTLTVMSLADPAAPDSVGTVDVSGTAYGVTVDGTRAFVTGSGGLDILDISQPENPLNLSTLDLGGIAYHVAVQGDSLFVATGSEGLNIIDISDPANPTVLATKLSSQYFHHTLLQDGFAWACNGQGGLLVLQADAQGLDPSRNLAVSTNLNPTGEPVVRAKLTATTADSVQFEISSNGGTSWQAIVPNGTWLDFDPQGTDLRWRATLVQTGPFPGPVCEDLTLVFDRAHNYAEITAASDVAGDAGGNLRLTWDASRFDAAGQEHLVTEYSVYRRYDPAKAVVLAYPPGDWEFLATVPADQEAVYAATVPTVADSSAFGTNWAVYFVRARTRTAGVYFDSPPDSGYSVNNIAPAAPIGFVVDRAVEGAQLSWEPSTDPDFAHYRIYRSATYMVWPSPATLYDVTTGSSYFDATDQVWFYHLTMVNLAGLESAPAPHPTPVASEPESGGRLTTNSPNPFNPTTHIAYEVPLGGRQVQLAVYDFRGRLVTRLVDGFINAGPQSVLWRGRDSSGRAVASGLYTCHLRCGNKVSTLKMTLVR